jgi:hypothetical protein
VWPHQGRVRYVVRDPGFPFGTLKRGDRLPQTTHAFRAITNARPGSTGVSESHSQAWTSRPDLDLFEQSGLTRNSHAVALLWGELTRKRGLSGEQVTHAVHGTSMIRVSVPTDSFSGSPWLRTAVINAAGKRVRSSPAPAQREAVKKFLARAVYFLSVPQRAEIDPVAVRSHGGRDFPVRMSGQQSRAGTDDQRHGQRDGDPPPSRVSSQQGQFISEDLGQGKQRP